MNPKRILVVDDERIVVRDIAESLESRGYEVCGIAMEGRDAIEKARRLRPDLILMDIVLQGDMDGIETACEIRKEFGIPVIFLTAYSQGAVLERAKSAEPLGYVLKPFDDSGLHSALEIALHKAVAEKQVREKGEWFHTTLKCIADAVISSDATGRIEFMNEAATRLTGWGLDEIEGKAVHEIIRFIVSERPPDAPDDYVDEIQLVTKDGRHVPVSKTASRIMDTKARVLGSVLVLRDDTARFAARQQQLQFQMGLEWLVKKRTEELEASNAMLREEIAIRQVAEITLRERLEVEEMLAGMSSRFALLRTDDIADGVNRATHELGTFFKARRVLTYEMSPDRTLLTSRYGWKADGVPDLSRRFLELNPESYFWMISQLALLQPILIRNVADLPPDAEAERQFLERSGLASALIVPLAHNAKLVGFLVIGWIRRDSVWKQNDIRALNMVGELISNALARAASGKSREALQAQLFQSQKVEAIGKLTGGVAHDFNNMLMPILGFTDLLLSRPPGEAADHEVLQQIRNAAESAATLASQLLAFSKKNILKRRAESLNAVVQKMERILDRVLGEDVELVTELAPDLRSAKLDVGQIEQILMNLALNSRAAMPNGGRLSIRTCNVAGAICGMEGNAVLLEIADTGCGMTPETLQQAFEPFFTTKGNQGTGLGLSVVQGIVEQHEGKIILDSQVGRGTTFHIFIPAETELAAEPESGEKIGASNFLEIQRGAGRHALVIEDEESVCEFLRVILSGCGFTVTTAANGQEGMIAFAEADGFFDVIICDIVLPDVDGIELAKEFLQTSPEVPIIISTGHSERFVSLPNGSVHLLKKPYSLSELCRKLDAVLVAPNEAAA